MMAVQSMAIAGPTAVGRGRRRTGWMQRGLMKQILTWFSILLTTGCVFMSPEPARGPTGKLVYTVECFGKEQNCYPQAKKLCPQGYAVTDSKYRAAMNWQGFEVENTLKYSLTVECHE
jgi:hypothetical protein